MPDPSKKIAAFLNEGGGTEERAESVYERAQLNVERMAGVLQNTADDIRDLTLDFSRGDRAAGDYFDFQNAHAEMQRIIRSFDRYSVQLDKALTDAGDAGRELLDARSKDDAHLQAMTRPARKGKKRVAKPGKRGRRKGGRRTSR